MSLLPDPDTLLAVAQRIAGHAGALRRHAHTLAASLADTTWHGRAARSFAGEASEICLSLRRSADRLDAAAAALRRHAARVRAVLAELLRAAHDAVALGLDADRVLRDVALHPERIGTDTRHLAASVAAAGGDALHAAGGAVSSAGRAATGVVGQALDVVGI